MIARMTRARRRRRRTRRNASPGRGGDGEMPAPGRAGHHVPPGAEARRRGDLEAYQACAFRDATAAKPANQVPTLDGVKVDGRRCWSAARRSRGCRARRCGCCRCSRRALSRRTRTRTGTPRRRTCSCRGTRRPAASTTRGRRRTTRTRRSRCPTRRSRRSRRRSGCSTYDDRLGVSWLTFRVRPKGWAPDAVGADAAIDAASEGGAG